MKDRQPRFRYGGFMSDEDPALGERSRAFVWMIGLAGLLAWFALLWLMFGDVL
jgi:hypothetical protein